LTPVGGFSEILFDFRSNDQLNGRSACESCAGFHPKIG